VSKDIQQRRILLVAVALTFLLGGAGAGGWAVHRWWNRRLADPEFVRTLQNGDGQDGPHAGGGPRAVPVRVDRARLEIVQPEQAIVGRLAEVRRATVSSEVEGKVLTMDVREGSPVVGGKTVLARVDGVWLEMSVTRQTARIEVISAQLRKAKHNLDKIKMLFDRGAATDHEYTDQRATYDQRDAELKEAQVALKDLKEQLSRTSIIAPFDGWVTARHAEVGQWLSRGSPVVSVVSRGEVYALMHVPESVVNQLTVGLEIPVTIDALGRTVRGKIHSITPDGAKASRTYPVRVALDDRGGRLKVGMSTTGTFPTGERRRRIMVSRDAVLIKPDGSTVWVVDDEDPKRAHPAPVEVVGRVADRYAVAPLTGAARAMLTDEAMVVVEGAERLRPKQAVRFLTAAKLPQGHAGRQDRGAEPPAPPKPGEPKASQ